MKRSATIKFDDGGTHVIDIGSRDLLAWERSVKGASMSKLASGHIGDWYAIAWAAAKRQGVVGPEMTLAEFEGACDVEIEIGKTADPTGPAA